MFSEKIFLYIALRSASKKVIYGMKYNHNILKKTALLGNSFCVFHLFWNAFYPNFTFIQMKRLVSKPNTTQKDYFY